MIKNPNNEVNHFTSITFGKTHLTSTEAKIEFSNGNFYSFSGTPPDWTTEVLLCGAEETCPAETYRREERVH